MKNKIDLTSRTPLILQSDSYKVSHYLQLPEGIQKSFAYIESRGGRFDQSMFFGILNSVKQNLMKPITMDDIETAQWYMDQHLGPGIFNRAGWELILERHNGFIPVEIRSVKEGSVLPVKNALVTIENTDPDLAWITTYLETFLLRDIWYATTVGTVSWRIKQILKFQTLAH